VAAFAANVRIFSNSLFGFSDYGAKLQLPKAATDKKPPEVFPSSILRGVERYVLDVKRGNVVGVNLSDFAGRPQSGTTSSGALLGMWRVGTSG
jgi:hypothetical protein